MFSPAVDLLFVANVLWPLLLVVDIAGGIDTHQRLLFWQIYFITAPHRWITLWLVATDRHRRGGRERLLLVFAVMVIAACLCLRLGSGSLLCLGALDYLWNAWHFASQHHGIFRIYQNRCPQSHDGRQALADSPPPRSAHWPRAEKVLFRGFMLYVIARVAGWGWTDSAWSQAAWVAAADWLLLAVPGGLVIRQFRRWLARPDTGLGSLVYLSSVMGLFVAMLLAAHYQNTQLVLQLALASAIFHSLEYLSIVTWSVQKSKSTDRLFASMARIWLVFLAGFVVVIGAGNYLLSRGMFDAWVMINLVVAFLHYGFDGMIWKAPKKRQASLAGAAR